MSKNKEENVLKKEDAENVSGGYIGSNNNGYAVYDNKTNELVVDIGDYRQAVKLDNLYNHQDQVEANAAKYDGKHKPWDFWFYKNK